MSVVREIKIFHQYSQKGLNKEKRKGKQKDKFNDLWNLFYKGYLLKISKALDVRKASLCSTIWIVELILAYKSILSITTWKKIPGYFQWKANFTKQTADAATSDQVFFRVKTDNAKSATYEWQAAAADCTFGWPTYASVWIICNIIIGSRLWDHEFTRSKEVHLHITIPLWDS